MLDVNEFLSWFEAGRFNSVLAFKDAGIVGKRVEQVAQAIKAIHDVNGTTFMEIISNLASRFYDMDESVPADSGLVGEGAVAIAAAFSTLFNMTDFPTLGKLTGMLCVFEEVLEHDFKPSEPGYLAVKTAVDHLRGLLSA